MRLQLPILTYSLAAQIGHLFFFCFFFAAMLMCWIVVHTLTKNLNRI